MRPPKLQRHQGTRLKYKIQVSWVSKLMILMVYHSHAAMKSKWWIFCHLNRCQGSMSRDHWMASNGGRSIEMKIRSKMSMVPSGTSRPISNCLSGPSLSFFFGFCRKLQYLLSKLDGVLWFAKGIRLVPTCATVAAAGGPRRLQGPHLTMSHTDHHCTWESTAVLEGNPTVLTTRNLTMYITVL